MISTVADAVRHDLGVEAGDLNPVNDEAIDLAAFEVRVGELEARITSMGPINPLALEELAALEERYGELEYSGQRRAPRAARTPRGAARPRRGDHGDLLGRLRRRNEHFSNLIATLFPGGQGRLIMSDPDDPLSTGVEIEAGPWDERAAHLAPFGR